MWRTIAIGLVILLGGCFPQAEAPTEPPAASPTAASPPAEAPIESPIASPTSPPAASPPEAPRTATFNVEGEPTQVELERYETPQFVTDIPKGQLVPTPESTDDGTGVRFNFSPTETVDENAYVQVFFPNEALSADALIEQISGDRGLIATNGWTAQNVEASPQYDWAQTAIDYQQPNADQIMGTIFVGEQDGKAFLVYTHLPAEYAEGFMPRANLLLENFEPR